MKVKLFAGNNKLSKFRTISKAEYVADCCVYQILNTGAAMIQGSYIKKIYKDFIFFNLFSYKRPACIIENLCWLGIYFTIEQ